MRTDRVVMDRRRLEMMNRIRHLVLLALLALAVAGSVAQERYSYDALGRLTGFVSSTGQVTEYVYDAVGNILAVRQVLATPPQISDVAPSNVRRAAMIPIVVSGSNLLGATITPGDPGFQVANLRAADAQVSFDLTIDASVPFGLHPFTLSSWTGSAPFSLTVKPVLVSIVAVPDTWSCVPAVRRSISPSGYRVPIAMTITSPWGLATRPWRRPPWSPSIFPPALRRPT